MTAKTWGAPTTTHAIALDDTVHKFGRNDAVANGAWSPVVSGGTLNWLQAASAVRIKAGGNANDDAAGTGARSVWVFGLDENWELANELIASSGTSASSATSTTFIRVFRTFVHEVGSYSGVNAGDIDIETTGGTLLIDIQAGDGQSEHCAYTVPAGYGAKVLRAYAEVPSSKTADFRMCIRMDADNVADNYRPIRVIYFRDEVSTETSATWPFPLYLPPKTDIWVDAYGNGTGVKASAELDMILEKI